MEVICEASLKERMIRNGTQSDSLYCHGKKDVGNGYTINSRRRRGKDNAEVVAKLAQKRKTALRV